MGHINLHKSNACGVELIRYLSELNCKYKLNNRGDILGMDCYGYNSRKARNQYSKPGTDYKSVHTLSDSASDSDDPTPSTSTGRGKRKKTAASKGRASKAPNANSNDWSDLWNLDLNSTIDPTQNFGDGVQ